VNDTRTTPPVRGRSPRARSIAVKLAALVLAVTVTNPMLTLAPVNPAAGTVPMSAREAVMWVVHKATEWSHLAGCLAVALLPTARSQAVCWRARVPTATGDTAPQMSGPGLATGHQSVEPVPGWVS
jgi:hypothetical protein